MANDRPFDNILEMIGNTPMLELTKFDADPCRLFVKLENQNPGGSIKDRIGMSMIEAAERDGRLKPGGTVIEATAGNTGLGLALVAAQKGYRMLVVMPDKMSQEKVHHLRALGAEVVMTRSDVGKGHPEYYHDVAQRLTRETPGAFWANQFENPDNPMAHETGTGPEIWEQMGHDVDAVVCGVGSGGTITGLGRFFARVAPNVEMILADPVGSILAEAVKTGKPAAEVGSWQVEGIGEDIVPKVCDLRLIRDAYVVSDAESFATARALLAKEGILAGSSTGTLLAAALKYCRAQTTAKRVVTLVCDSGNKYLSKMYNDYWMYDQGFLERPRFGNLRDLIARRVEDRAAITVKPDDTLLIAYGRMRLYDVSQLPVVQEQNHIVGIVDESDILLAVHHRESRFQEPVADHMSSRLEVVAPDATIDDLVPIFRADRVAIVVDGGKFLGLITQVDLLNHLRQKVS
jgi:cystathionine beta-synthase